MTSTNCKCLQKCSLASLGQSVEIKGHVCPSISLFVCVSVCLLLLLFFFIFWVRCTQYFFSNRHWEHVNDRVGAGYPVGIFFNQGSDFIYISSSSNYSVEV